MGLNSSWLACHDRLVALVTSLPAFLLAVLAISAVPGPAMALILRRAAVNGGRATVPLVLGLETALVFWAVAAAVGLAALVAVSQIAYAVLRIAGAVVLVVLGLMALRAAWLIRRRAGTGTSDQLVEGSAVAAGPAIRTGRAYSEGLVTNLANPKAAVFMVAFFPQFIPHDYPVLPSTLLLASIQVTVEAVLYCTLAFAVARARRVLAQPRVGAWIEGISGTILLGLAAKVATSARAAV
jgi:threonine/homoserine/homoserine lactone efflux protein